MEEFELFEPGEMIVWKDNLPDRSHETVGKFKEEWGAGPFRIVGIRKAHDEAAASHPQVLYIYLSETKRDFPFSGYWFTHVRH